MTGHPAPPWSWKYQDAWRSVHRCPWSLLPFPAVSPVSYTAGYAYYEVGQQVWSGLHGYPLPWQETSYEGSLPAVLPCLRNSSTVPVLLHHLQEAQPLRQIPSPVPRRSSRYLLQNHEEDLQQLFPCPVRDRQGWSQRTADEWYTALLTFASDPYVPLLQLRMPSLS